MGMWDRWAYCTQYSTYGCMHIPVGVHLWKDDPYDGFTSTWTDGVNVLYLHTSWSGEGLHWN